MNAKTIAARLLTARIHAASYPTEALLRRVAKLREQLKEARAAERRAAK
jgi:hypothetical protein